MYEIYCQHASRLFGFTMFLSNASMRGVTYRYFSNDNVSDAFFRHKLISIYLVNFFVGLQLRFPIWMLGYEGVQ